MACSPNGRLATGLRWTAVAGLAGLVASFAACGLSTDVTTGPVTTSGGGRTATSSSDGVGGSGGRRDAATSTTGASGGVAGGGGNGGSTSSTAGSTTGMGGGGGGARPCTPADPGVCCPDDRCSTKCCQAAAVITCAPSCPGGTNFACDDSRDCPAGKLCCGNWDSNISHYAGDVKCVDTQMCMTPFNEGNSGPYEICDLAQPNCAQARTCKPEPDLGGGSHGYCF